jgi:cytochrome c oxidase subunit 4
MLQTDQSEEKTSAATYWMAYIALMILLVLTAGLAYVNLGPLNTAVSLAIAFAKALLIFWFFMHARQSRGLVRIFAGAGVFWLLIMFSLTFSDYLTRGWSADF